MTQVIFGKISPISSMLTFLTVTTLTLTEFQLMVLIIAVVVGSASYYGVLKEVPFVCQIEAN